MIQKLKHNSKLRLILSMLNLAILGTSAFAVIYDYHANLFRVIMFVCLAIYLALFSLQMAHLRKIENEIKEVQQKRLRLQKK